MNRPIATIPIELARHNVLVPVSIQGSEPFRLILDTGMPIPGVLLLPSPRLDSLELPPQAGRTTVRGAGGSGARLSTRATVASSITLCGYVLAQVPVIALPSDPGFPDDVDGVIGAELFEKFTVRVDADGRKVELFDSSTWTPPATGVSVPLRLVNRKAFIDVKVAVESGEPATAEVAVDLGAGHSLWLNPCSQQFEPPARTITTSLGRGLSGELRGRIGRVKRLEIGPFVFDQVVTIFPDPEHQNPGGGDFRDGFIGGEILTRFVVTFDYTHQRMVLEPGARFTEPFEYDTNGQL